jgi:hypothetical protein
MSETFTPEQLSAEKQGKSYPWDSRQRPETYTPVQLQRDPLGWKELPCIDWWSTRSKFLNCCFPFAYCCLGKGKKVFDSTNEIEFWKEQLANESSNKCPDSMKGVWWLKDNIAHEKLVTIFSDAEMVGTFNEDGTDGYGTWSRSMHYNWSRDRNCFGYILSLNGKITKSNVNAVMNMKDGKMRVGGHGDQIVYRVSDDEWWKTHYAAKPGEVGGDYITYMYKWLKVLDKDGNPTQYYEEYVKMSKQQLPNNTTCIHCCCCSYCWPMCGGCVSGVQIKENMAYPNPTQIVMLRD